MNINILLNEELISYIESGVIESVPSDRVLEIIQDLKEQVEDLRKELKDQASEIRWLENKSCEFCYDE